MGTPVPAASAPTAANTASAPKVSAKAKFTAAPKKAPQATTGAVPKAPPSTAPSASDLDDDPLRAMALAQLAAAEGEDDVTKDAPEAKRQKTGGEVPTAT